MSILEDLQPGQKIRVIARATGQAGVDGGEGGKGPQLLIQFEIRSDQPYGGDFITYYQRLVDEQNFVWASKALRACGASGESVEDLAGITANEVELVIAARMYEGKKYVEVKYVNPPGGPELKIKTPAAVPQLRALSALMKMAAASTGATPAAKTSTPAAAPPTFAAPSASIPVAPSVDEADAYAPDDDAGAYEAGAADPF